MELADALRKAGVETKEAERIANIVESANQNELDYMSVFIAGIKVGEEVERYRKRRPRITRKDVEAFEREQAEKQEAEDER